MNRITVSEDFVEGFVKAAAEQGLSPEEIAGLYKVATYIKAGAGHSQHFEEGVNEVLAKQGQELARAPGMLARGLSHAGRMGKGLGILGLLGLGGLGMYGGQQLGRGAANEIEQSKLFSDLQKQQQLNARHKTMTHLINAYSGVPTMPAGMYGYGGMLP